MASTGRCQYCGATVSSEDRVCTSCGAPNPNYVEKTGRTVFLPKTIDELREYCAERGMPLVRMRFFIGEDYHEPKAFGIYRDGNDFVVYKNKSDGSRAIRYKGPDEAHAVDEIFKKLLEECHNRGIYPDGKPPQGTKSSDNRKKKRNDILTIVFAVIWALTMVFTTLADRHEHRDDGYYSYGSGIYYRYGTDWYYSDSDYDWYYVPEFPEGDYTGYYAGEDYDSDWGVSDFESSAIWEQIQDDHSTSSDDYDSWDSGDTDWDSDW